MKSIRFHLCDPRLLISAVLAAVLTLTTSTGALAQPTSQGLAVILLPGTVELDELIEPAIIRALEEAQVATEEMPYFAVTDMRVLSGWALASVAGLADMQDPNDWNLEDNGRWMGLIALRQLGTGQWEGATSDTPGFQPLLEQAPTPLLDETAKQQLSSTERLSAGSYVFPWTPGTSMVYGPFGVHDSGSVSGWKAVDMASDGDTAQGHSPNRIVAAESATIDFVCTDGTATSVRMGGFLYTHLLPNSKLHAGRSFIQGEEMGQLKTGNFTAPCGYGYQGANWFHLHWGFPNATLQVEDWTLSMSTQNWTRGSEVIGPGAGWITAGAGTGAGCAGLTLPGVTLWENTDCNAAAGGISQGFPVATGWIGILAGLDDSTASIHVAPGWSATVYERSVAAGGGSWSCLNGSIPNLAVEYFDHGNTALSLRDTITSIQAFDGPDCLPSLELVHWYPADGEHVCLAPMVGVELNLADPTQSGALFDPATISLSLDGIEVISKATFTTAMTFPVSHVSVAYTPDGNLGAGTHTAVVRFPSASGVRGRTWNFVTEGVTCQTSTLGPDGAPLVSSAESDTVLSQEFAASQQSGAIDSAEPQAAPDGAAAPEATVGAPGALPIFFAPGRPIQTPYRILLLVR